VKLHREALGRSQRSLLPRLAPLARQHGFYLAGGTALALQLGHRRSVDFDWFREDPIDDPLRLAADVRAAGLRFETDRVEKGTLHGQASGVRVSFLEYGYPLLRPLREVEGLRLAALEDIAAMKLAAVAQRGSKKDFVDVFALGGRFGLSDMLAPTGRSTASRTWATSSSPSPTSTTPTASGRRRSCSGSPGPT
jgi:hypothetical protein